MKWIDIGPATSACALPSGVLVRTVEKVAYEPVSASSSVAMMFVPMAADVAAKWIDDEEKDWKRQQRKGNA